MVAKYSTTKNTGHRQTTDHGNGSSLKLNSVYAVKLKNSLKTPVLQEQERHGRIRQCEKHKSEHTEGRTDPHTH